MFLIPHLRLGVIGVQPLTVCAHPLGYTRAAVDNVAGKHNRLDSSLSAHLCEALRVLDLSTKIGQRQNIHVVLLLCNSLAVLLGALATLTHFVQEPDALL